MRSSRVKVLLAAVLAVVILFSTVNAHDGHEHRKVVEDLEEEDVFAAPSTEPTPVKTVELPTFTVCTWLEDNC